MVTVTGTVSGPEQWGHQMSFRLSSHVPVSGQHRVPETETVSTSFFYQLLEFAAILIARRDKERATSCSTAPPTTMIRVARLLVAILAASGYAVAVAGVAASADHFLPRSRFLVASSTVEFGGGAPRLRSLKMKIPKSCKGKDTKGMKGKGTKGMALKSMKGCSTLVPTKAPILGSPAPVGSPSAGPAPGAGSPEPSSRPSVSHQPSDRPSHKPSSTPSKMPIIG